MPGQPTTLPPIARDTPAEFDGVYFRALLTELRDAADLARQPVLALLIAQALEEARRIDEAKERARA